MSAPGQPTQCLVSALKPIGNYDANNKVIIKPESTRKNVKGSPDSIASPTVLSGTVAGGGGTEITLEEKLKQAHEIIKLQQSEINRQSQLIYQLQQCVSTAAFDSIVSSLEKSENSTPVGPAGVRSMMKLSRTHSNNSMVNPPVTDRQFSSGSESVVTVEDVAGLSSDLGIPSISAGPLSAPGSFQIAASPCNQDPHGEVSDAPESSERLLMHSQSQKVMAVVSDETTAEEPATRTQSQPNLKGLGARLLNSSKSRRRLSRSKQETNSSVKFRWTQDANEDSPLLFIVHDNQLLGTNITNSMGQGGAAAGMELLLESRDDTDSRLTTVLVARILFSGMLSEVEDNGEAKRGGALSVITQTNNRGSCCIVCRPNTIAYKVDLKSVQQKQDGDEQSSVALRYSSYSTSKDILEFNVHSSMSDIVDVSSRTKLYQYLDSCKNSKVDVILHPYYTLEAGSSKSEKAESACNCKPSSALWLPYWENARPKTDSAGNIKAMLSGRKMAPQFRSQAIGYLRLGDDMSMFGGAYLSLDAGCTFVLNNNNNCNITHVHASASSSPVPTDIPTPSGIATTPAGAATPTGDFACGLAIGMEYDDILNQTAGVMTDYIGSNSVTATCPEYLQLHSEGPMKWQEVMEHVFALLTERILRDVMELRECRYAVGEDTLAVNLLLVGTSKIPVPEKSLIRILDSIVILLNKMKQKNCQIVLGTIRIFAHLVGTIHVSSASSAIQSVVKQGFACLLGLLKSHNNKLVQEGVTSALTQVSKYMVTTDSETRFSAMTFSVSYIHRNSILVELFPSLNKLISGGPSAAMKGNVTFTVQSVKVLQYLTLMVSREMDMYVWLLLRRPGSGSMAVQKSEICFPLLGTTVDDILGCLALCKLCVGYKDATVRDAGQQLASHLLAYALVLHAYQNRAGNITQLFLEAVTEASLVTLFDPISESVSAVISVMLGAHKSCSEKLAKYTNQVVQKYGVVMTKHPTAESCAMMNRLPPPGSLHMTNGPPRSPEKLPTVSPPQVAPNTQPSKIPPELYDQWFEVKLCLRAPLPHSAREWLDCRGIMKKAFSFFQELTSLSGYLSDLQIRRGGSAVGISRQYLFREYILAFDENTSSNDQSDTAGSSTNSSEFEKLFAMSNEDNVSALSKIIPDFVGPKELLSRYKTIAVQIRRLIRVKMADEADIKQAISTIKLITKFIDSVEEYVQTCSSSKENVHSVIKSLDN